MTGPLRPPTDPFSSNGAPPVSRPVSASCPFPVRAVVSPRPVIAMREASSVKTGRVVRSTKRTKPSETVTSPRVTTGNGPSAGGRGLEGAPPPPGAGAGVAAGASGVSRSISGNPPSVSRSTRAHG